MRAINYPTNRYNFCVEQLRIRDTFFFFLLLCSCIRYFRCSFVDLLTLSARDAVGKVQKQRDNSISHRYGCIRFDFGLELMIVVGCLADERRIICAPVAAAHPSYSVFLCDSITPMRSATFHSNATSSFIVTLHVLLLLAKKHISTVCNEHVFGPSLTGISPSH